MLETLFKAPEYSVGDRVVSLLQDETYGYIRAILDGGLTADVIWTDYPKDIGPLRSHQAVRDLRLAPTKQLPLITAEIVHLPKVEILGPGSDLTLTQIVTSGSTPEINRLYAKLHPADSKLLIHSATQIRGLLRRTAEELAVIGAALLQAKSILDGEFHTWVQTEVGLPERQAQRFMSVAHRFPPDKLSGVLANLQPSAAYLLAGSSEDAFIEAVSRAEQGEIITHKIAQTIVKGQRTKAVFTSGNDENYTPQELLEMVYECLGSVDLDPCSNMGIPNVRAKWHFTKLDNALEQDWDSKTLYANFPYSLNAEFTDKFLSEWERGIIGEAIILIPSRTDTKYWHKLSDECTAMCLHHGRIHFVSGDEGSPNTSSAPFPSAWFYFGEDVCQFWHVFGVLGDCWQKISPELIGC